MNSTDIRRPPRLATSPSLLIAVAVTTVSMSVSFAPVAWAQFCPPPQLDPVVVPERFLPRVRIEPPLLQDELNTTGLYARAGRSVVAVEIGSGSTFGHSGSGLVWDNDGHVVTNSHVVDGASSFRVVTTEVSFDNAVDGGIWRRVRERRYAAELVGKSLWHDLAVLKINALDPEYYAVPVTAAHYGVAVGQNVYAIGYPETAYDRRTLTSGIVSGLSRHMAREDGTVTFDMIQTDASVNPGNSGGPLFDSAGNLIGVNTAVAPVEGVRVETANFAVPVDAVCRVVPALISSGYYSRPRLGALRGALMDSGGADMYFLSEQRNEDASHAGDLFADGWAAASDVGEYSSLIRAVTILWSNVRDRVTIRRIGGYTVNGSQDVWRVLGYFQPASTVAVEAWDSNGREVTRDVTLSEGPSRGEPRDQFGNPFRPW